MNYKPYQIFFLALLVILLSSTGHAQKFLPDDPITEDPDNLPTGKPAFISRSPTADMYINSLGSEAGALVRAQNINTLGEVPDSSWFTNRIGVRDMTLEELMQGENVTGGFDASGPLTVVGAALVSITDGLIVRDGRGDIYYVKFDPPGLPVLSTAAEIITTNFFHAIGFNVLPAFIAYVDGDQLKVDPEAKVLMLGAKEKPMDQEFIKLVLEYAQKNENGLYRVVAQKFPVADFIGGFEFYGTRSDDPNDIFDHENRRELRGMRIFSAWLNHYNSRAINTLDFYFPEEGMKYLKHYLLDFSTALGSGHDVRDRIIPKDPMSGNEYNLMGAPMATLKTGLTLGIWQRPWLKIKYPYPKYAEIGRIEGDYFQPERWKPAYPNAAFDRMLPDDAFWAASIVARFSDQAIRAIVSTGQFSDPEAEAYLADTLIKRRDKIIDHYFRHINPLDGFRVTGSTLEFQNLGERHGLASGSTYEYLWSIFDNSSGETTSLGEKQTTDGTMIPIPEEEAEYLLVHIRTRNKEARGWKKNVGVYLRNQEGNFSVVGVDRETGEFVLERAFGAGEEVMAASIEFGGTYDNLEPEQQQLAEDWVRRFNEVTGQNKTAEEVYDDMYLSSRTTFEAVTNALMETDLTDASGNDMGTALDLVDKLDAVKGKIKGARGDLQFRMYVQLKPDALDTLEACQEFARGHENTIYHKGYPINYRQQVKAPSIQYSVSTDGKRADIDVDYRSSKIPQALFNGHLTSSNSDVRAGKNYQGHTNQWEGLQSWWRGLFGLPSLRSSDYGVEEGARYEIPPFPRAGEGKVEEAVLDYLTSWLVEQEPRLAVAYLAQSAYACMPPVEEGEPVDLGVAPFLMIQRMSAINDIIGKAESLEGISTAVSAKDPRLKRVQHPHDALFELFDVPEDMALAFDCASRDLPETQGKKGDPNKYGKYFASIFYLSAPSGRRSGTMGLLWTKENKIWRIVSYEVEPEEEAARVPDLRTAEALEIKRVDGDPSFIQANLDFLNAWFVDQDYQKAFSFFSTECFDCINLYKRGEAPAVQTEEEAEQHLLNALELISVKLHAAGLEEAVEDIEPSNPVVYLVAHEDEALYSLLSVPDHIAEDFVCSVYTGGEMHFEEPETPVYGNYFATAFMVKLIGAEPAVFYLLWTRENGDWKIIAYHVVTP